ESRPRILLGLTTALVFEWPLIPQQACRARSMRRHSGGEVPMADILFEPLQFKNLKVKNRIFRSNISGRFDNYDGSGNHARINVEGEVARSGVGAIISSFVPVQIRGRIMPNYATIDTDERIPFWRAVAKEVHKFDCKYLLQLIHGCPPRGRARQ